jgi:hypothetical protein
MRPGQSTSAFACLLAAAVLLGGCGSGDSSETASAAPESRPAPPKSAFPPANGRTLTKVLDEAKPAELVVSPAGGVFYQGKNRFPFGVFQKDRTQVPDAQVALYFAPVPEVNKKAEKPGAKGAAARAQIKAREEPAIGPFPAKVESLVTQPAFRALTTSEDPDAASVVYSTDIDFPGDGEWRIAALVKEGDNEYTGTLLPSIVVGSVSRIPRVGDRAPLIHTPTPEDVGGDLSKITTRIPPDTQNQVDYADVLGKEPIILLFATPQFCQSRVCGPVVDVAEQVKQLYGDKAAFIHMEIWKENDPSTEEVRPQVSAFHLPSEPWLFAIERDGRVGAVLQGAFGVEALTEAVEKVTGG